MRSRRTEMLAPVALVALVALAAPVVSAGPQTDVAARAREVLDAHCVRCHGLNGAASKSVFVLDRDRLVAGGTVVPGDERSPLLAAVDSGAMPLGGPELSAEERAALHAWVRAGAPRWDDPSARPARAFLGESEIVTLIRDDLERVQPRDRVFKRYFSLAHLANAGLTDDELDEYRLGLTLLLNSLSWRREIATPDPVDPSGVLLRVDLRDLDWTAVTWRMLETAYPYALATAEAEAIERLSESEVPYLRADWFVSSASVPPLYHDVLGLPETVAELERMLGVDAARSIEQERNVVRAGVRASGVSRNNRAFERHETPYGAYWKTFDFRGNGAHESIFRNPLDFTPAGGEIIFHLPNGLQAYLLADGAGRRIDTAPVDVVADRTSADDPVIRNGRSCMRCHFAGVNAFKDDVRPVLSTSASGLFDREKALALYQPQTRLDALVSSDRERFRQAVERAGGRIPATPYAEPISGLAQRFGSDLSVAQAASEMGLRPEDFQSRLRLNPRSGALGLAQLLVPDGGVKRDAWTQSFADLVGDLRPGGALPSRARFALPRPGWTASDAPQDRTVLTRSKTSPVPAAPSALRGGRTLLVRSTSSFVSSKDIEKKLRERPEVQGWRLEFTQDPSRADLILEVRRIKFTVEFPFQILDARTGAVLAKGRVNSLGGTVPGKLSNEFVQLFGAMRP